MPSIKAIHSKIASVKNIQKITRAMQMVAASKMRKAQDRMKASRPYAVKILGVIRHLATAHPEYRNTYMEHRDIKAVGYIVVTTDRGLCGALNLNILKETMLEFKKWSAKNVEQEVCAVGNKADAFFHKYGIKIAAKINNIDVDTGAGDLIGAVKVVMDAYRDGRVDALYICFNQFVSTMAQRPRVLQLLPIIPEEPEEKTEEHYWDYIYEPDSRELLDSLLQRYIEMGVYQAVVENLACEQSARMIAMMNATDNAGTLIDNLRLAYNKARQATITTEISEIVGGAEALK
jgi:F-type H+-transporting ATPase subunit gamma